MNAPPDPRIDAIAAHPSYRELRRKRNRLGWFLTLLVLIGFYGFMGLIAFDKAFLAQPIAAGKVTSVGIPIALGLMLFTIVVTALYVYRANTAYDALTKQILEDVE